MLYTYDSLVKPITVHGSEVCIDQSGADDVFLCFARQVLRVKPTTIIIIVLDELGVLPPSVNCIISMLCYMNRLYNLTNSKMIMI